MVTPVALGRVLVLKTSTCFDVRNIYLQKENILAMVDVGFITYVNIGEECGVYTIAGTSQKHHYVCNGGNFCGTKGHFDGTESSVCVSETKLLGDKCSFVCNDDIPCLQNEYDEYTCGGITMGRKNTYELKTITPQNSSFDIVSVVLGTTLLLIWIILKIKHMLK